MPVVAILTPAPMASSSKLQLRAKLLYNKKEDTGFWRLGFAAPAITKDCLPGQFLTLRLTDGCQPLLRRPFSIHRATSAKIEILYEVVGRATEILSQKKPAEYLDIIGPLGRGFALNQDPLALNIIIAGGMGVAPLFFLAEKLRKRPRVKGQGRYLILLGAKTKNRILCEREFRQSGFEIKLATDDGTRGFKGKVTELLKNILADDATNSRNANNTIMLYACGPRPMLKEITAISKRQRIPAQISLEEHMACGFGACLGCVVNTREGYKRVCQDGPVFNAQDILW